MYGGGRETGQGGAPASQSQLSCRATEGTGRGRGTLSPCAPPPRGRQLRPQPTLRPPHSKRRECGVPGAMQSPRGRRELSHMPPREALRGVTPWSHFQQQGRSAALGCSQGPASHPLLVLGEGLGGGPGHAPAWGAGASERRDQAARAAACVPRAQACGWPLCSAGDREDSSSCGTGSVGTKQGTAAVRWGKDPHSPGGRKCSCPGSSTASAGARVQS